MPAIKAPTSPVLAPAQRIEDEPDGVLLARFNAGQSEAFTPLVARHLNWIYSSARHQVKDPHLAEDVTQTVFLILARKSRSLQGQMRLSPWLFRVTRYTCLQALRAARRREFHERKASAMAKQSDQAQGAGDAEQNPAMLDAFVARLNPREREAVLLRFYEGKTFPAVGEALGISEEAARKRVERAVQTLRQKMNRREVTISASAFAALLLARSA